MPLIVTAGPGNRLYVASGGGGGGSPAAGDSNFNFATRLITGTPAILDMRQDYSAAPRSNVIWCASGGAYQQRAAAHTYIPGGGYYGQGCQHFVPGNFTGDPGNPLGDHPAGIGQLLGFNAVAGGSQIVTVGILWAYGSGLIAESNGIKSVVMLRDGGPSSRPMIIPKGTYSGAGTLVLPPCDGTLCNASETILPEGSENYFNSPATSLPDISANFGQWIWTEMSVDCSQTPPLMHTRSWFADSTELGTHVLKKRLYEENGGYISGVDIIGYYNSIASPTANCWMRVERVEIHVGQFGPITPPVGFPGSAR